MATSKTIKKTWHVPQMTHKRERRLLVTCIQGRRLRRTVDKNRGGTKQAATSRRAVVLLLQQMLRSGRHDNKRTRIRSPLLRWDSFEVSRQTWAKKTHAEQGKLTWRGLTWSEWTRVLPSKKMTEQTDTSNVSRNYTTSVCVV